MAPASGAIRPAGDRGAGSAGWPCSIARTIDLLGDWWTPLVLREAFYGTTRFGDTWLSGTDGPPVILRHTTCQHDTQAEVVCSHCRQPLRIGDITPRLGPGYPARHRTAALATGRFGPD